MPKIFLPENGDYDYEFEMRVRVRITTPYKLDEKELWERAQSTSEWWDWDAISTLENITEKVHNA